MAPDSSTNSSGTASTGGGRGADSGAGGGAASSKAVGQQRICSDRTKPKVAAPASEAVISEVDVAAEEVSSEQSDSSDSSKDGGSPSGGQQDASEAANAWLDKPRFTKGVWPKVRSLFKATFSGHCVWYCTAKCSNGADCDLLHELPDGFAEFCEQAVGLE